MAEAKTQVTLQEMRDWFERVEVSEVRDLSEFLRSVREVLSGVCSDPTQNDVDFTVKRVRERVSAAVALLSQFPGGLENALVVDQDKPEVDIPEFGIHIDKEERDG